ncbi:MAG: arginine deiminase-related protein [Bacteroidota bacterium]
MTTVLQTTSNVMMVRPANFGFNEQTAASNAFQSDSGELTPAEISHRAIEEFDTFVARLRAKGIKVLVVEDSPQPVRPDAVFPNNWVTFHQNGQIITYPMYAPLRRHERRHEVLEQMKAQFDVKAIHRLEEAEGRELFLEGTGSMILDRQHRIVYACTSPRTDEALLDEFCQLMDYRKCQFQAVDGEGQDIYHTNVMMALGETFVVICLATIRDEAERQQTLDFFAQTNKTVIDITLDQMMAYAGNMLQLRNTDGDTYLVMSEQALRSLRADQIEQISQHTHILSSPIYTIEAYGGGSARCMIAEVFLPEK